MRWLVAAAVLLPLVALAHGPGGHETDAAQAPANNPPVKNPPFKNRWGASYFPNVELVTQDGKRVRFYDDLLKGKAVAINFVFTECSEVCTLETANLARVHSLLGERAGRDVHFYSISLDPDNDTPATLKAYARKFDARWTFLTGRPEDVKLVGKKLGMLRERDEKANSHHAALLMIGDEPKGQWSRHSAVDSPPFLVARMGTFLGWRDDPRAQKSYADARPLEAADGKRLFSSKCSGCHTIGQGSKLGPDLAGVAGRRPRAWLARYIAAPDEMLAAGDPAASALFKQYKEVRMPNLRLAESEVAELVRFLEVTRR